ncbi:MAG: DUF4831 family protein [Bacteroidales bacterium]|nr:DUF4831 family protein [Bacteroidales bacterium]
MNKLFFLLLIIALSSCKIHETFHVVPVDNLGEKPVEEGKKEAIKKEGVYYALPRTRVIVNVAVKKTSRYRGPYAGFASRYLGINNVIEKNESVYDIRDIKISTFYEPDPEQFYFVEFDDEQSASAHSIMMELTEAGLIANVNNTSKYSSSRDLTYVVDEERNDLSKTFKYFPDQNLYEKVDTLIEEVTRDTVTIKKQILKRKMVEKTEEQKAREAADFILKVREQKMNLITGYQETPYPKETVEYMFEELENMENDYLKLFTGMHTTQVLNYRYSFMPVKDSSVIRKPLFKFSTQEGVMDAKSETGEMVYLQLNTKDIATSMEDHMRKNYEQAPDQNKNGFYYRMPATANISVWLGSKLKAEALYPVSQFGVVNALPNRYDKIRFYPSTGMIKTIDSAGKDKSR